MTKISQLSSIGDSLAVDDQFLIRDVSDGSTPNKSVTVSGITRALDVGTAAAPAIAFATDKNTGIYSPGADQVAISTNGSGRLFVDASGNVGIGTAASATAGRLLDINGVALQSTIQLRASSATSARTEYTLDAANNLVTLISSDWPVRYFINGNERLRITSAGLVGIGTSSPSNTAGFSQQLELAGNIPCITINQTNAGFTLRKYSIGVDTTGALGIWDNTPSAYRLYINSSGNVGIGTNGPTALLSLADSTAPNIDFTTSGAVKRAIIKSTNAELNLNALTGNAITFTIDTSEAVKIDGSRRLLVGTSSARSNFYNSSDHAFIQLEGVTNPDSSFSIVQNYNAITNGPSLVFGKNNSQTKGTNVLVSSGDTLGRVSFQGNDGAEFVAAADITVVVDGTPGANDMPGRLVFSVTADGASSPTEAMRIKNSRILNFANTPVYADNAAAKTGGLVDGDVYRKSDGTLMIVYT